jgi:hypothetical protein
VHSIFLNAWTLHACIISTICMVTQRHKSQTIIICLLIICAHSK